MGLTSFDDMKNSVIDIDATCLLYTSDAADIYSV